MVAENSPYHYDNTRNDSQHVTEYGFLSCARNLSNKRGKQSLDTGTKTGTNALKTASKKVIHKAATGEFLGKKIADKIVKLKPVIDENSRNIDEIILPTKKREDILHELRKAL